MEQGPYLRTPAFIAGYALAAPPALADSADPASIAHGARG
jgi:hypothetical protein